MDSTVIDLVPEFELENAQKVAIAQLLATCFPGAEYNGRIYYKQLPHYRLLLKTNNTLIGQLALDYRVMNVNQTVVRVMGVIDLAVHPNYQGKGLGKRLMLALDNIAQKNKHNIDFLFLVTDKPLFYEQLGYTKTVQKVSWLKIDDGKNYGMGYEQVDDCFLMVKKMGSLNWEDGELDMLGYWY